MRSVYNTDWKFEGLLQGKKCTSYTGKYGSGVPVNCNTYPILQLSIAGQQFTLTSSLGNVPEYNAVWVTSLSTMQSG